MMEYAKEQGKIISDFILDQIQNGEVELVVPENYKISQSMVSPDETIECNLIYFLNGSKMELKFKSSGNNVKELVRKLIMTMLPGKKL